ncbi:MAG: hypothetical protein Q8941_17195 [Bacteroidota bacterium]|nr:hypothetical protein [Bacteroidota bacterium]
MRNFIASLSFRLFKKNYMEHKKKLEELNKESLQKLEDYVKTKGELKGEDHEKLHRAKDEWQTAWRKLMDALMVLERLEI